MVMNKAIILPQEIILDIFSLLPAKSVGQCRCLSKQWCKLLSDPQFIKAHLTNIHAHKTGEGNVIWVSRSFSLHTSTLNQNPENGTDIISRKLNFQQLSENWVTFGGSCNGLVLIVNREKIQFLINPTTLKYHEIPKFHLALPVLGSMYGLGYDSATDDYKVVTVCEDDYEVEQDSGITFFDVYSVRKGLWRRVESSPFSFSSLSHGVLLNGALHWHVRSHSDGSFIILAFDLSDEKFLEVTGPTTGDGRFETYYDLVAFGACLCLSICTGPNIDVWKMNKYGVEESWTKFVVIGSLYGFIPLCLISDHDVVSEVVGEGKLIVYNIKEDLWRDMMVGGIISEVKSTGIFIESLVSPT